MDQITERARAWLAQDPDPETRAELSALLRDGDDAELRERFAGRLEFGTAGLRGELGAGPMRMNRVTVLRAAAGLCRWLGPGKTIVIGYDARHKSDVFARDTAAVATGAGLRALLLPRPLPTPVLAYAIGHVAADAGVMVTASHNPARDNGYKVYVGASQIIPPTDAEISAAIDEIGPVNELPLGDDGEVLDDEVVRSYLEALRDLPLGEPRGAADARTGAGDATGGRTDARGVADDATCAQTGARDVTGGRSGARDVAVAYTPMHGVGRDTAVGAFAYAGFPAPAVVAEQAEPDPDFPTVAFPNPEEPGALDLAMDLGSRTGADLVIANDPDADRCAVAIPGVRRLSGDELGGLLAEHVLARTTGADRLIATTIVSSSLLARIAEAHGVRYAETLTGFKWLARADGPDDRLVYAYEEALGYCVGTDAGPLVRDKDGISAALTVAAMTAAAKREGRTLLDLLDAQARRYGVHATRQVSIRVADLPLIAAAMTRLRAHPPENFGDLRVERAEDLLPDADVLRYRLTGGVRVIVRPSGTEPKLKTYLEVVEPPENDVAGARSRAETRLDILSKQVTDTLAL